MVLPFTTSAAFPSAAEPVRLVIWDLDGTFWSGTLTEGGITYRQNVHDIVVELARRGIPSSICSKNDLAPVRRILEEHGLWAYFVFPSINWEPKGARVAAILEAARLRPASVLFIDDNATNLAEAAQRAPGLQVANESLVADMLADPRFAGHPDPELSRLGHYRQLEQRHAAHGGAQGDAEDFLRSSDIRVSIEHDIERHLDRAIELINRTNQLNFTKDRLPEDSESARAALRALLSDYTIQAGILRVTDRFGDHGYCGLYILRRGSAANRLVQFCFSCRIAGLGIETWLYRRLGQPQLAVKGAVLNDVRTDGRVIDWITLERAGRLHLISGGAPVFPYVYIRGGCELRALGHYFELVSRSVFGDFSIVRNGTNLRLEHSMFAHYALKGVSPRIVQAFASIGYSEEDFTSALTSLPYAENPVWVMSYWADANFAVYRPKNTASPIPLTLPGMPTSKRDATRFDPSAAPNPEARRILEALQADFEYRGAIREALFKRNLREILARAPERARIFVLLAPDQASTDATRAGAAARTAFNGWTADVLSDHPGAETVSITPFVQRPSEYLGGFHFDRMVYYRLYEHILARCGVAQGLLDAAPAA